MYDINLILGKDPEKIEFFASLIEKIAVPYHQAEVRGINRVSKDPVLFVGNHNGALNSIDSFIFLTNIYRTLGISALPYSLTHKIILQLPFINETIMPMGCVLANQENGLKLLSSGNNVLVYPGGDFEGFRPFRDKGKIVFAGRKGYIRLALKAGVPIVPVVASGAHSVYIILDDLKWLAKHFPDFMRMKIWPLTLSIPWGITIGPIFYIAYPSKIIIEVLEPIYFENTGKKEAEDEEWVSQCAELVEAKMQSVLSRLDIERKLIKNNQKNYFNW